MDNISQHILLTQNESSHIDELLAQRKAYSLAKRYFWVLLMITVPAPILLSLFIHNYPSLSIESSWIYSLYVIIAAFGEKLLDGIINRHKKIGASIQEIFDTKVLKILTNESLNKAFIHKEIIRRYSYSARKSKKNIDSVTNWYSKEIEGVKSNIAILLCQRTNISYDFSVRKRYNSLIKIIAALTFISLLIISLTNSIDLESFLVEVILPSIPIYIFSYNEIINNTNSIDNLDHLRNLIEKKLEEVNINDEIGNKFLREIQDRIYYNRVISTLIPNCIYTLLRRRLEDEMNYSIKEIIVQLKHHI